MANKEDDIDGIAVEDAEDDTAAKAESIGKDLGVEGSDGKEVIPDYDVQEAPDDRIAKTREGAVATADKKDRRELTNKEKRDAKKRKQREAFRQKDAIIEQQQRQIEELANRQAQTENRLAGVDKGQVKTALNDTIKLFNAATEKHTQAFADGDGAKATIAMREMYDAQKRIDQLQDLDRRLEQRPQQEQQRPQFDAIVVNHATEWAKNNTWFKKDAQGNAANEDSEIAMALSARLVKEGFDPKSEEFWEELSDRAEKRMPHVADAKDDDDEDDEPVAQPRKRTAPPVGGGSNRGDIKGKVSVQVSTAYIDELKKNGLWDDKPTRDRLIHAHLTWKRNNPDAR